jgi:hypothetical protein
MFSKVPTFSDLINGKTVAIVGPAKSVGDQSAQVEACDTVIRLNYRWTTDKPLHGYGDRLHAAFYSIDGANRVKNKQDLLDALPCVVLKHGAVNLVHRNIRYAKQDPFEHANQVSIVLNEIEQYGPAGVWIFGADFYTTGPQGYQQTEYRDNISLGEQWEAIRFHNQRKQHEWMREFQNRTNLVKGDERVVELLSLTTNELMKKLEDAWRGVFDDF